MFCDLLQAAASKRIFFSRPPPPPWAVPGGAQGAEQRCVAGTLSGSCGAVSERERVCVIVVCARVSDAATLAAYLAPVIHDLGLEGLNSVEGVWCVEGGGTTCRV